MKDAKYFKKGQIAGNAVGNIIGLIVGVGIAVMILIFVGTLSGSVYNLVEEDIDELGSKLAVNTSFVGLNDTSVYLGHLDIRPETLVILNSTTPFTNWSLSNWTIDYGLGTALLETEIVGNGSTFLASYEYGNTSIVNSIRGSILSGFDAIEQTGNYLPIIVLAVIITIVLSLILSFGGLGSGRGGAAL